MYSVKIVSSGFYFATIILLLLNSCGCARISPRSGYGEYCNDTIRCDKRAMLSCQDSQCSCIMLDEMIYDSNEEKCVSKVGERCKFGVLDNSQGTDTISLYEMMGCVNSATCSKDGICECDPNFFESFDGNCYPQRYFNEKCSDHNECRTDKFLKCIDGICDCNRTTSLWGYGPYLMFQEGEMCVGKAGLVLEEVDTCIEGSVPNNQRECICRPDMYAGEDGLCHLKKSRNSKCLRDDECVFLHRYLSCVNGTCDCDPNLYQWRSDTFIARSPWDIYENGQCVGLAGKPSNFENNCVLNAHYDMSRYCECDYGYYKTIKGTCGTGHGSTCSKNVECSDKYICSNGRCKCPAPKHQIYKSENQHCVSVISGPCHDSSDCVPNANCEFIQKYGYNQCRCNSGFVETSDGKCQHAYGSECDYLMQNQDTDSICDTLANLECRDGICDCPDSLSFFSTDLRKCLDRVGSRCSDNNTCAPNASCVNLKKNLDTSGNCECNEHYTVNHEKLCEKIVDNNYVLVDYTITEDPIDGKNFMNMLARITIK